MGWGQLPHPIPERCFHDLLHRHGFETKDAVGAGKTKPGASWNFSSWSKAVGLDQSPLRQAIGVRMLGNSPRPYSLCLPPLQIPSQPQLSQPGLSSACFPPCRHSPGTRGLAAGSPGAAIPPVLKGSLGCTGRGDKRGGAGEEVKGGNARQKTPPLRRTGRRSPGKAGGGRSTSGRASPPLRRPALPAYLQTGELCWISQVRTASPEVSSSESINANKKKKKKI